MSEADRYHLKYDMGSDGEFEFRRQELAAHKLYPSCAYRTLLCQELAHMSDRNLTEVSDDEVVQSYEDSGIAQVIREGRRAMRFDDEP